MRYNRLLIATAAVYLTLAGCSKTEESIKNIKPENSVPVTIREEKTLDTSDISYKFLKETKKFDSVSQEGYNLMIRRMKICRDLLKYNIIQAQKNPQKAEFYKAEAEKYNNLFNKYLLEMDQSLNDDKRWASNLEKRIQAK
jgi:hypothetical protein